MAQGQYEVDCYNFQRDFCGRRSMSTSALVSFYRNSGPDHAGRMIAEIHGFDFHKLERTHDYIQWLFPLVTRSGFNRAAPILTEDDRALFHHDAVVRDHFRKSLSLMMEFYGFRDTGCSELERTERWLERRDNWQTRDNHNLLRITRILRSSMLCGFVPEARAFHNAVMQAAEERPGSCDKSYAFWNASVNSVPNPPASR